MRPPVMQIADHPALDFLNTVGAPRSETYEWLGDGQDLLDWMRLSGLVAPEALTTLAARTKMGALDATAQTARDLREALRAYLETGAPEVIDQLNSILSTEHSHMQLQIDGAGFGLQRVTRLQSADSLLVPLAASIADLLAHTDTARRRNCGGPTCTMWFLDVSKNNKRRWCSMAVCGNRAKAAAHRAKTKTS